MTPKLSKRRLLTGLPLLLALAAGVHAQTAAEAPLALRNLQIEVRQSRGASAEGSAMGARGDIRLRPGESEARVEIGARAGQNQNARELLQRVLVLNGRAVTINLGNSTPLRLVQGFFENGRLRYVGSDVLIGTNSGFSALPVWRGGDSAELELTAVQAARGGPGGAVASSSASSVLRLPLNEWFTVAESDDSSASSSSGLAGAGQAAARETLRVEVRVSLR